MAPTKTSRRVDRSESTAPRCVAEALAHEKLQRQREEINALYVAMTRAKVQLAISAHEVSRPDPQCPWLRLEAAMQEDGGAPIEEAWHGDFAPAAGLQRASSAVAGDVAPRSCSD